MVLTVRQISWHSRTVTSWRNSHLGLTWWEFSDQFTFLLDNDLATILCCLHLSELLSSFSIPHLTSTFPIQSPQNLLAAKFDDIFHLEAERLHPASVLGPWLRCRFTKSPLSAVHHCTTQPPSWIQCKDGRKWSLLEDFCIGHIIKTSYQLLINFRSCYSMLEKSVARSKGEKYQVSCHHPPTCCETSQLDPVLAMRCLCSSSS